MRILSGVLSGLSFVLFGCSVSQTPNGEPLRDFDHVNRTQHFVDARDGVKLHVVVVAPEDVDEPLPIILKRTPYGISRNLEEGPIERAYRELAEDGYIFAYTDVRGRGESEGQFVMNGPLHDPNDPNGVDEVTDTWDTIEWLVDNVPNNSGNVGVVGGSYPGWLAAFCDCKVFRKA